MDKLKLVFAAIVAIILIILIVQNREDVEIRLLVATVTMPRALLIAITALFGFAIGVLASLAFSRQRGREKSTPAQH